MPTGSARWRYHGFDARVAAALILVTAWGCLCAYAYPGYMSFDSVVQLREARSGVYSDWHPPAMALLWRWADFVVPGPFAMFALQSATFIAGLFLVIKRYTASVIAAALASIVFLFPPLSTAMAVVWKDCQMLGFLTLGLALLLRRRTSTNIAGLALVTAASAMRYNAFTITLPIVTLLLVWSPRHRALARYGVALATWAAITAGAQLANGALTTHRMYPWYGSVAEFDIVGVIRSAPPMDDASLREILDGTPLEQHTDIQKRARHAYSPGDGVFRVVDAHFMRQPKTPRERSAIADAWRRLVLAHPLAYLRHRARAFGELLGLPREMRQWIWVGTDAVGQDLVEHRPSATQSRLQRFALWFGTTWLMRPYLYVLAVLALLPFCIKDREETALALAASVLTSEGALFFLCPTPDFRYSLWSVVSALLIVVILVSSRVSRRGNARQAVAAA